MNLEELINFSAHLEEIIDVQIEDINKILVSYGISVQDNIEDGLNLIPRGEKNG